MVQNPSAYEKGSALAGPLIVPLNLHKGAKVNEGPHPTSLRSATFPIGEGKAVKQLRSKSAFPYGEGARRADEVLRSLNLPKAPYVRNRARNAAVCA